MKYILFVISFYLVFPLCSLAEAQGEVLRVWAYGSLPSKVIRNKTKPFFDALSSEIASPIEFYASSNSQQVIQNCDNSYYGLLFAPPHIVQKILANCKYKSFATISQDVYLYKKNTDNKMRLEDIKTLAIFGEGLEGHIAIKELSKVNSHFKKVYFTNYLEFLKIAQTSGIDVLAMKKTGIKAFSLIENDWIAFHKLKGRDSFYALIAEDLNLKKSAAIQKFILENTAISKSVFQDALGYGEFEPIVSSNKVQ